MSEREIFDRTRRGDALTRAMRVTSMGTLAVTPHARRVEIAARFAEFLAAGGDEEEGIRYRALDCALQQTTVGEEVLEAAEAFRRFLAGATPASGG